MDSKNNFLKSFMIFIDSCSDDVLAHISNKGIVKRAIKDLEKDLVPEIIIEDHEIISKLGNEAQCTLSDNIKESTCTCPSRTVCKHIITSLIFIRDNKDSLLGCNEEDFKKEVENITFDNVLNYDLEILRKKLGNNKLKEILFRFQYGIDAIIEESYLLTIKYNNSNEEVRFYHNKPIEESICNCKSKELCIHKGEAIIHYKFKKGILDLASLKALVVTKIDFDLINEIEEILKDILELGLSKISTNMLERIEICAIACGAKDMPSLEKKMRSLQSYLKDFFEKKATFEVNSFRRFITEIFISCQVLRSADHDSLKNHIIGENRTTYYEIPSITLLGLGRDKWSTFSGYNGTTYYFYSENSGQWYTYNQMTPNYYENNQNGYRKNLYEDYIWNDISLHNISKSKISLLKAKINRNNRLSSSKETSCNIISKTSFNDIDFGKKIYTNWSALKDYMESKYSYLGENKEENFNLFLLKIESYGQLVYDEKVQRLTIPIYDEDNNEANLVLNYREDSKDKIEKIESLHRNKNLPKWIIGRVYKREGSWNISPILGYNKEGRSIF